MKKYKLIVDSSCDISPDYYQKHNVGVTDLIVTLNERTYRDRVDITSEEILKIYKESKQLPKTSALNIVDLQEIFKENLKEYEHIFYLPISSEISSLFNNARLASAQMDNLGTVLDSEQLSSGIALEVIGLVKDIEANKDVDEIVKNFEERKKRIRMSFVVDTLEFLHKGGRCSGLMFLLGNKFHLHPIIRLANKKMSVATISRGKGIERGIGDICKEFKNQLEKGNIDLEYPIFVPNVVSPHGVKEVKKNLEELVGDKIIFPVDASGIICCHCGENTCGLAYMLKEPIGK